MDENLKKDLRKYVPIRELHFYISRKVGEEPKGYTTKDALVDKLEKITKTAHDFEEIRKLLIKYKFAGKGSISWSKPSDESSLTKEELQKKIKENLERDPFSEELRPQLTNVPRLNKADWLRDNLLKLEFVYSDHPYLIEENYEFREIVPTRRTAILIRILNSPFVVESRAPFSRSIHLHKTVSEILGIDTEILDFSDIDVQRIKFRLNAKKKAAKHKKASGDFDTVEVVAAPHIDDLDTSSEYSGSLSADELRKVRYKFVYETLDKNKMEVTIHISNKGGIWFVSEVPEEVIEYVFSCIREIKHL